MRDRAQTVIVGAGIVGTSAAYHLAELGLTDVLVLDQGPLFETGGSSSHAPGLVFQTNGSRTMCRIAQDTVALYDGLSLDGEPCWFGVGGIEVATTPERMQELKRRQGFARSFGLEETELITPAEASSGSPCSIRSTILGAYFVPTDGIAKAARIAAALARAAEARGVAFEGGVTVTGFDVRDGRVRGVETDRGHVDCERVLLCGGIWGPRSERWRASRFRSSRCSTSWSGPIPSPSSPGDAGGGPSDPRHQDTVDVSPPPWDHYGVGQLQARADRRRRSRRCAGRAARCSRRSSRSPRRTSTSPSRRRRAASGARRDDAPVDPARSLNGMFSFTPDAGSIVGESARVRGFWVCEAVWVTHGGGMGRRSPSG